VPAEYGAAVGMSFSGLLIKNLTGKDDPDKVVLIALVLQAPVALVPAILVWRPLTAELWGVFALIGVVGMLGHITLTRAFRAAEASLVMSLEFARLPYAVLFGFVLTYYRVPQEFTQLFLSFELSPFLVLAIVLVFYIILGMFLEPVSMTFITLPTIYPLMHAAGFDLIWFGVVYTITMEIAVLTPPVGLNLYVIQGIGRGV